jgi:hypothetical protein
MQLVKQWLEFKLELERIEFKLELERIGFKLELERIEFKLELERIEFKLELERIELIEGWFVKFELEDINFLLVMILNNWVMVYHDCYIMVSFQLVWFHRLQIFPF